MTLNGLYSVSWVWASERDSDFLSSAKYHIWTPDCPNPISVGGYHEREGTVNMRALSSGSALQHLCVFKRSSACHSYELRKVDHL